jgi:peptide-methionine (S)-S-oxide reductase
MKISSHIVLSLLLIAISCTSAINKEEPLMSDLKKELEDSSVAYFASGCFWCVEAVFESVKGVEEAISGYAGGEAKNANYKEVSSGRTDHAEAVAVYYDPEVIDYETLLVVFFASHDPTTKDQQGPDRGRQYRSAIFYTNAQEERLAKNYVRKLLDEKTFHKITSEIVPFEAFYPAEKYHQNYKKKNPNDPYVKGVSNPRLEKFKRKHPELLK